ncbi:MAG TPA: YdhK family protein [Metabacillus sp.]|nr:YdhK family protein [Metabacillus sp.]
MKGKIGLGFLTGLLAIALAACAGNSDETADESKDMSSNSEESMEMDHSEMHHSGSGEVPEGLKEEKNPTYKVGSQAILETDHMEGMKGTEATIVGAYDTTVYAVSYTPTTGGERVENHKWVIHEELENSGDEPFEPGEEVVLNADHMKGMKGATAVIDSANDMTVYMVDYTSTTDGEEVKNHKWVTESELSPKQD